MQPDENKPEFNLNIGMPSIMLIFTVLCLIAFGVLSLAGANTDLRLSHKALEHSKNYYNACSLAAEDISRFDAALRHANDSDALSQKELIDDYSEHFVYYVSDIQHLSVQLSVNYPLSPDKPLYKIDEWRVVTDTDIEYDDNLHINTQ